MANILENSVDKVLEAIEDSGRSVSATRMQLIGIIKRHAASASAAALAGGFIPGGAGAAVTAASIGFIWTMYYRTAKALNINLKKSTVKALASAVITNVLNGILSIVAACTIASFLPGGVLISAAVSGVVSYYLLYYSGVIFLNMLVRLFGGKYNIEQMTDEELGEFQKQVAGMYSFKDIKTEAAQAYKHRRQDGREDTLDEAAV